MKTLSFSDSHFLLLRSGSYVYTYEPLYISPGEQRLACARSGLAYSVDFFASYTRDEIVCCLASCTRVVSSVFRAAWIALEPAGGDRDRVPACWGAGASAALAAGLSSLKQFQEPVKSRSVGCMRVEDFGDGVERWAGVSR